MAIDTNYSIRYYFDDLYLAKKQAATYRASSRVELLKLPNMAPTPRVLRIIKELDLLQMKRAVFPRNEYVNFADDLPHLYNYYSGNLYFCSCDEEEILFESLVLSETIRLLSALLLEAMAQLPLFTYANFLNDDKNVAFYELNRQPWGTSPEEYTAMRCWQANRKQECVHLESTRWKARFIVSVKGLPGNMEAVQAERNQVISFYANAPKMTPGDCITQLSRLRVFPADSMPENASQWHDSFCRFVKGKPMPYALSPGSLQLAFRHIEAGKISNAPVCAWSLMKYKNWLDNVLCGKTDLNELPEFSYDDLFENNLTISPLKRKKTISVFNKPNEQTL